MAGYTEYYKKFDHQVYPSEWIVRSFLGRYQKYTSPARRGEGFKLDKSIYKGKKILDIGYGDGRNLSFFNSLEMEVYGVEPSKELIEFSKSLFPWAYLKKGQNCNVPFDDNLFDFLVASHSIYYLSEKQTLIASLREAARVLKVKGEIFFTVPTSNNHTLRKAERLGNSNQWILEDAFYNVRKGQIIETIDSEVELISVLEKVGFNSISIAMWKVDWWGTLEESFLVRAKKNEI